MQRRQPGQGLTLRERALAARDARLAARDARAAQSATFQRQRLRASAGSIPMPASSQYSDEIKDNEIGPKRPKFINPSDVTIPQTNHFVQFNNRVPLTAIEYHNQIVRQRNANISRVLEDIRNTSIPMAFGDIPRGRTGLFVNNLDRNLNQRMNLMIHRHSFDDEKQN